ncbi:MAG: DNA translocase FtsK [Anaerolineae bacterium]|nr:DNA translocase FtsK [Anaerolineae bacterium]
MARALQPYLEYQADRVEAVLAAHRSPGRVTGGMVGPQLIQFFLNPAPHTRFTAIRRLADDLALALHVPNLRIARNADNIVLEFANPKPQSVNLLTLLQSIMPLPVGTALLGLTENGTPLLMRLSSPDVAHVLIAGTTGSGKSVLMRSIAVSLALNHRPDVLRMVCIDPKNRTFRALAGMPHLSRPPVKDLTEAVEVLRSLVRVMEIRDQRGEAPDNPTGVTAPRIAVFIDELADLVLQGEFALNEALTRLLQRGREAGIHLIAATQRPSSAVLSGLMRANFPLRLVGRVVSADDARVASGRAGTQAHLLSGHGDFLAVTGGDAPLRFQAAHIDEKALQQHLRSTSETRLHALPLPSTT